MITTFTFGLLQGNKEEYLAYRSNWKAEYKKLSQTIRNLRTMAKIESQACNQARKELGINSIHGSTRFKWHEYFKQIENILSTNDKYKELKLKVDDEKSYFINKYKQKATLMLAELKESKIESQIQYFNSKKKKMELTMA